MGIGSMNHYRSPEEIEALIKRAIATPIDQWVRSCLGDPAKSTQGGNLLQYHCPWREDSNPSLFLNLHKNTWFDAGRNEGGGSIKLGAKIFGIDSKIEIAEKIVGSR